MESLIESAARKAGVPTEVLDVIGRDYITQLVKDLPSLMLPPVMADLKKVFREEGSGLDEGQHRPICRSTSGC